MSDTVATMNTAGGALTIEDAVAYSAIGRSTLYGLIREGEIRVIKVGRRTIVPRSELDAFIARRMAVAPARPA